MEPYYRKKITKETFEEVINYLLNSEDFINKLMQKMSDAVEERDVRLVCSDMIATLEWEEVQEQFEKNLRDKVDNEIYREIKETDEQ